MNRKLIVGIVIVVIIVIIIIAVPMYRSYQEETLSGEFNESLKNVSAIEGEVIATVDQYNSQNSTDADDLVNSINNDMNPKYSEEITQLNETHNYAQTDAENQYIDLQIKRIGLESESLNNTVTTLNALSGYVRGEKSESDAQNTINEVSEKSVQTANDINQTYTDIRNLLDENPDLNKTLHDLELENAFYGEGTSAAEDTATNETSDNANNITEASTENSNNTITT